MNIFCQPSAFLFSRKPWLPAPTLLTTEDGQILTTEGGKALAGDNLQTSKPKGVNRVKAVNKGKVNTW